MRVEVKPPNQKKKKKKSKEKKTIAFYFRALCWLVCDANIGFESAKDQKINDTFT
jgi:hypothetical protein